VVLNIEFLNLLWFACCWLSFEIFMLKSLFAGKSLVRVEFQESLEKIDCN
jgi:uncharacterized membrane protein